MKRTLKTIMLTALIMVGFSMTGCVKFKQVLTLMPDGSGKIDVSFGMSAQMIQMAKQQGGEDPFKEMSPKKLAAESKGIVAFTKPVKKTEGGYTYMSFSAYFKDINKVELGGPDGEEKPASFTYKRDGDAATLTAKNTMMLSAAREYKPMKPEEKQFAAQMVKGMSLKEHYVLPGLFADVKGATVADNVAKIEINEQDMLDGTGPLKDLKGVEALVFKIEEVKEDKEKIEAFKKELEAAVEAWEKEKDKEDDAAE